MGSGIPLPTLIYNLVYTAPILSLFNIKFKSFSNGFIQKILTPMPSLICFASQSAAAFASLKTWVTLTLILAINCVMFCDRFCRYHGAFSFLFRMFTSLNESVATRTCWIFCFTHRWIPIFIAKNSYCSTLGDPSLAWKAKTTSQFPLRSSPAHPWLVIDTDTSVFSMNSPKFGFIYVQVCCSVAFHFGFTLRFSHSIQICVVYVASVMSVTR